MCSFARWDGPMDSKRQLNEIGFIFGLVIAPATAPISFFFFLAFLVAIDQAFDIGVRSIGILGLTFLAGTFGFLLSYFVAWAFGAPYVLWLQRTGRLKFRNFIAMLVPSALLLYFLCGLVFLKEPSLKHCCFCALYFLIITAPSIVVAALCFWLISVRRCPGQAKKQAISPAI